MNLASLIKRILFYGLILLISTIIFFYLNLSVTGAVTYKVFLVLSIVSGSIQSINFLVIRKISDIQKIQKIGFWARWRLSDRIESRRITAFLRATVGILMALIAGGFSAWMNILDLNLVPYWGLGLATGVALISIFMLFLTLYEFSVITKLESELNSEAEKREQKQKAIKSIKGDNEEI